MFGKYIILASCVLGLAIGGVALCDQSSNRGQAASDPAQNATAKPSEPGRPYTSVIIDVSGFSVQRSMSPKVRKPDGTEVWGTVKVDPDAIQDKGIVAYAVSMDEAMKNSRCGSNPMIVRAVAVYGAADADAVVAIDDAKLIVSENDKGHFLDKFNVIFVKGSRSAEMAKSR